MKKFNNFFSFSILGILYIFFATSNVAAEYAIVAGSFKNNANAEKLAAEIKSKGYEVNVLKTTTNIGEMYRVCIGIETTLQAAKSLQSKLVTDLKQSNFWILEHDFARGTSKAQQNTADVIKKKDSHIPKNDNSHDKIEKKETLEQTTIVSEKEKNEAKSVVSSKKIDIKEAQKSNKKLTPDISKQKIKETNDTVIIRQSDKKASIQKMPDIDDIEVRSVKADVTKKDDIQEIKKDEPIKAEIKKIPEPDEVINNRKTVTATIETVEKTDADVSMDISGIDKSSSKSKKKSSKVDTKATELNSNNDIASAANVYPERKNAPENVNLQEFLRSFKAIVNTLERQDHERMSQYIHPDFGYLVITRNDGKNMAMQLKSSEEYFELQQVKNSYAIVMKDLKTTRLTIPKVGSLPKYDCAKKKYNGLGLFAAQVNAAKIKETPFPDTNNGKLLASFSGISDFEAINSENQIIYGFYFTNYDGKWYLSMINMVEPCEM